MYLLSIRIAFCIFYSRSIDFLYNNNIYGFMFKQNKMDDQGWKCIKV